MTEKIIISGPGGLRQEVTRQQLDEESLAATIKAQLRQKARQLNQKAKGTPLTQDKAKELKETDIRL